MRKTHESTEIKKDPVLELRHHRNRKGPITMLLYRGEEVAVSQLTKIELF